MGRELKRVPLDFDWPLEKVWDGFINPHYTAHDCEHCGGTGSSPAARRLSDQWYGKADFDPAETGSQWLTPSTPAVRAFAERQIARAPEFYGSGEGAIVREGMRLCAMWNTQWCHHLDQDDVNALWAAGRLYDFNPNWTENHNEGVPPPTAQQVNDWAVLTMGHDSLNNWVCVKAKCVRLGQPYFCEHCDGEGEIWPSAEAKAAYEAWTEIEPPIGEGYQVWETVTEGSPISPVFATTEELERWLIGEGYSEGAAEQFAIQGFAFSAAMVGGTVYKDIESLNAAQDGD